MTNEKNSVQPDSEVTDKGYSLEPLAFEIAKYIDETNFDRAREVLRKAIATAHSRGIAEGIERASRMVCQYCDHPAEWAKAIPDPYPHAGVGRLEHLPLSGQGSGRGCAAWAIRGLSSDPNYISSVRREVWDEAIKITVRREAEYKEMLANAEHTVPANHVHTRQVFAADAAAVSHHITTALEAARDKQKEGA